MSDIEKVEIGSAVLYRGNCLEVMQTIERADHVITDPPYEDEAHTANRQVMGREGIEIAALKFAAMDEVTRSEITRLVVEKTNGWALFFCQVEANDFWRRGLEAAGGKYFSTMAWVKSDAKPNYRGNGPGIGYENIVLGWCGEGKSSWNGGGRSGVFVHNKNEKKDDGNTHGTIKPQKLMVELVKLFTNPGELILDTFMGSGSTGVAAVSSGRKFIGIERDPEYFEICCSRIEAAQKENMMGGGYVKIKSRVVVDMFKGPETAAKVPAATSPKAAKPRAAPKPRGQAKEPTKRFTMPEIEGDEDDERPAAVSTPRRPLPSPYASFQHLLDQYKDDLIPFDDVDKWLERTERAPLGCDVESFKNWFLINFQNFTNGDKLSLELSERSNLHRGVINKILSRDRIITFNGRSYDLPMIIKSLDENITPAELKEASDVIIRDRVKYWDIEKTIGIRIPNKIDHIDLFDPNPAVRQGLKILNGRLHGRMMMDLPFHPDKYLSPREMNIGTMYCFNDIDALKNLYDAMKEPLELRRELSNEYGIDMRSKSDAQVGEAIIKARVKKLTGRTPKTGGEPEESSFQYEVPAFVSFKTEQLQTMLNDVRNATFWSGTAGGKVILPKELEKREIIIGSMTYRMGGGGLHSTEKRRAIVAGNGMKLRDVDVSSQYPLIILKVGVYPKAIGPVFLVVYKTLIDERLTAKEQAKVLLDQIEELKKQGANDIEVIFQAYTKEKVKAEGGKISSNGVFGKGGSIYSVLYSPRMLMHTTVTGQLSLFMLIEAAKLRNIEVVSANTDGVVFHYHESKEEELDQLIREWEEQTSFKVEHAEYKAIYNASVNSYIAVKPNGKFKLKGDHADPWSEGDLRAMMMKNPQMTVLTHAVLAYLKDGTDFETTIKACTDVRAFVTINNVEGGGEWRGQKIGKVVRYYWSTDNDAIVKCVPNSKGTKTKVSNTAGARPLMEMTGELPDDIDYDKYTAEAKKLALSLAVIEEDKGSLM